MRARHLVVSAFAVVLLIGSSGVADARKNRVKDLPKEWQVWLNEEVYPLITAKQRDAFLELETEEQRAAFAERLWQLWGSESGIGTAFRRIYEDRLETCRSEYENTIEDRCRVLLIHGIPEAHKTLDCPEVFYPLEFWQYARIEGLGEWVTVLFYKPYGVGRYRMWDPFETRMALYSTPGQMKMQNYRGAMDPWGRPEERCGDVREILSLLASAEYWMKDMKAKALLNHYPIGQEDDVESASARFLQYSTLVDADAEKLDFSVDPQVGDRRGGLMKVAFAIDLGREGLGTSTVGDKSVVQLDVVGEISRDGDMADRFRYAFTLPAEAESIPLVVERELRPARYHLRLKIEDENSKHAGVDEVDFEVKPPVLAPEEAPDPNVARAIAEAADTGERVVSLRGPEGEGVSGVQRFMALAGKDVASVEFLLDGKSVLQKNRPPFEVELDLGPLPRLATVTAVAYDARHRTLDRSEIELNVGRERFFVRLQPLGPADIEDGRVHAVATVNVPTDKALDRVEVYWNETKAATLYQPPFDAWVPFEADESFGYLRALAVLDDGGQAEDLEFINGPQFVSGIQVDAVELPVAVLDRSGKPVEGLEAAAFRVEEDGVPQTLSHFSLQRDLPIRLGLVLDTSGSMEKTLPDVQRVVLGFLEKLLRPRDRAFIVAFSDRPALVEGFTADFGALERALIALRADRETALFDATVYGLFQFSGVRGRKAMIILSDGKDNISEMDYDRTLDYAIRSGVTIYTIGIDLPITDLRTRAHLSRLASATGGQPFFLARDSKLDSVYEQIERELRTQYLLAYTSSSEESPDEFRKVEVKVDRPGTEVRTIAGYYPTP